MIKAELASEQEKLRTSLARRFAWADLPHMAVRLCPAAALFGLVFTGDPLLQWLSVLGVIPLALAFLPGVPGGGCACRASGAGRPMLPPAH